MTASREFASFSPSSANGDQLERKEGAGCNRRRRLRKVILQAGVAIGLLTSPALIWSMANQPFARGLRRRRKELHQKPIRETLPDLHNEAFLQSLDRAYRTGFPFHNREVNLVVGSQPGKLPEMTRWKLSCSPLKNRRGKVLGLWLFGWEIKNATDPKNQDHCGLGAAVMPAQEQPRILTALLQQARDEERMKISRELHDTTGQLLTVLSLNVSQALQSNVEPSSAQKLRESLELIDEMSDELHAIARSSRPSLIEQAGLQRAVARLVQTFSKRSGIAVRTEIGADLAGLTPDQETAVFRIVQEALTNVQRHSQSPTAAVRITRAPTEIRVEVRDQGKGFGAKPGFPKSASAGSGLGIEGMRERLRLLGGQLEIQSTASGTRLLAAMPVSSAAISARVKKNGSVTT